MNKSIINLIQNNLLALSDKEFETFYKEVSSGVDFLESDISKLTGAFNSWGKIDNNDSFQIDLPYWNSYKEGMNTVMVIGMDAKRSSLSTKLPKEIVLNTPFALHSKNGRETKKNQYWNILSLLIGEYNIYTTDLYKLYFNQINSINFEKKPSNKVIDYTAMSVHKELFQEGILLVNPSVIICFGNEARAACAKIFNLKLQKSITKESLQNIYTIKIGGNNIKFVAIPHPSGLTRLDNWVDFFNANGIEEQVEYDTRPDTIVSLIKNAIK